MTEHVHDYQYHIVHQGKKAFYWYAKCECGDRLEKEEIENRLNKYDALIEYVLEQVGEEHVPVEFGGLLE